MSSVSRVVRGGLWLYASTVLGNVTGFAYWLVVSAVAGSEVLGLTSATVGLASLINGALSLGINVGLRHFLGSCLGAGDLSCFRRFLWTSTVFSTGLYSVAGASLLIAGYFGASLAGFTPSMLFMAGALVLLGPSAVIQSAVVSTLRTEVVFLASLVGNAGKLVLGYALVRMGLGFVGAAAGYSILPLSMILVGVAYVLRFAGFGDLGGLGVLKDVIRGSVVAWLPSVVVLAGQWLGVIAVFGVSGGVATGHYYVAFTIANFVLGVSVMMISLLLPVLSGMSDGRKAAASRILRISLAVVTPLAVFICFYPHVPLSFLGEEYVEASSQLVVLLISSVPLAVYFAVYTLVYAYRMYSRVLYLGLAQNVPRLLLYLTLVPAAGGLGAALAFTAGALVGFLYASLLARKVGFMIDWVGITKVVGLPAFLTTVPWVAHLPWQVALLFLILAYSLYGRAGVLRRADIRELAVALLGEGAVSRIYSRLSWLIDALFPL